MPIEGALVDVGGGGVPDDPRAVFLSRRSGAVSTSSTGAFLLRNVSDEPGYLAVQHPHYRPFLGPLGDRGPLTVTLTAGARIVGRVQSATGTDVRATVLARGPSGGNFSEAQEDGSYVIWGLAPGTYQVSVYAEHGPLESYRSRSVVAPAGGDVRVDFQEVTTGADLTLELVAPDGKGVEARAALYPGVVRAPTTWEDFQTLQGESLPGSYGPRPVFRHLDPGNYTLVLVRPQGEGAGIYSRSIEVTPASPQELRVTVPDTLPTLPLPGRSPRR